VDETPILTERREGWRRIVLNRPDRLNAFTEPMHAALAAALDEADRDEETRCVLLTGAGRAFCSGQDLSARRRAPGDPPPDLRVTLDRWYNPLIRRIRSFRMPVVCAVNGTAAGAGANLALACDVVLAARSATFVQAFARIGLIPDSGGTWVLPRLVGEARARALAITAEPVSAETAEAWGMIWRCVDDADLASEAEALAARLATQPTVGFALLKRALGATWDNGLDAQLDLERDLQGEAGRTPDYAEGVEAFFAKRRPVFTGRR